MKALAAPFRSKPRFSIHQGGPSEIAAGSRIWTVCLRSVLVGGAMLLGLVGCRHPGPTIPMDGYWAALEATAPGNAELMERGTETEAEAIDAFIALWSVFEADRLRGGVTALYAEDAYFRDTFGEFHSAQDLEAYLVRSAEPVKYCTFDIQDWVATDTGDYYFRWIMELKLKRYAHRPPNVSKGMSHVRFNPEGRIIFHVDYWDAGNLYEQFPIIGGSIRWVKRRLAD